MAGRRAKPKAKPSKGYKRLSYSHLLDETVGCADMLLLEAVAEGDLVENLKKRYNAGEIYTYISTVMVSVNPYRPLDIYTDDYISEYRSRNMLELPPHIFAIADQAYCSMRDRNMDQCIIISGESGAGKTEASKLVMQYIAAVSGRGLEVDRVKEQLLQSNPVLEAYGNAKTNRNDNSSRFGKYMDIEFDFKGDPVGGIISNYLLEKSRVVSQAEGERNFHIFYQMLAGSSSDVLQMLHLEREVFSYPYLSGCSYVLSMDDEKSFHATTKAMEVVGFSPDEISISLELLAAILNLGNVKFEGYHLPNGTDACKLNNVKYVSYACDMLGCSQQLLSQCLTHRSFETRRDLVMKPLSASEGSYVRDALCKAIYNRLFSYVVKRINDSIKVKTRAKRKAMGVLDIYGFEVTESNSFEQFIINYCNEKLQQVFIELTLKSEQEEYIREGIEWEHIDYFNNATICELIEHPHKGIMAMLDDECLRPGEATDETFLRRINQKCLEHPHYQSRAMKKFRNDQTLGREEFRLIHYAGKVTYNTNGFLDKNKDFLFKDLSEAMFACERKLLRELFPEGDPVLKTLKRPPTAATQFKSSVSQLMKNLLSKNPNYIRCIKPNDSKESRNFNDSLVQHQTRYLGLIENIRVRRAGFAFRQLYEEALTRYKMLSTKTWPKWKGRPKDGVKEIMKACGRRAPGDYSMGRTKVFVRHPRTVFDMEKRRTLRMQDIVTLIQKTYKGWHQWRLYQRMRQAQITISSNYRGYVLRTRYQQMREATIVIQKYCRGWQARVELRRLKFIVRATWAVGIIRKWFYGWKARKLYRQMRYAIKYEAAAIVIQKYYRGWKVRAEHRTKFKNIAGPLIADFMWRAVCCNFLMDLAENLPSDSPLDRRWPYVSWLFEDASAYLQKMHHKWRCKKIRDSYNSNPSRKRRMMEKARASALFRGKKSLYEKTIGIPFKVDRIGLRNDARWMKLVAQTNEQRVVWADNAQKVNRSDGKKTPMVLVVTGASLMVLEPKHWGLKYRVELSHISCVSLSSFSDCIFIIHVDPVQSRSMRDPSYAKGDFMFQNPNVIEMVTKIHAVIRESFRKKLEVKIDNEVCANFKPGDNPVQIRFHHSITSDTSSPVCKRRGGALQITV